MATNSFIDKFNELKAKHPDAILLIRDFPLYKSFGTDAEDILQILHIAGCPKSGSVTLPCYGLDKFMTQLIRAGKRVAVVDGDKEKEYGSEFLGEKKQWDFYVRKKGESKQVWSGYLTLEEAEHYAEMLSITPCILGYRTKPVYVHAFCKANGDFIIKNQ